MPNRAFQLTAQLNIQAPQNLKPVINSIQQQLGNVKVNIDIKLDPNAASKVAALNTQLKELNKTLSNIASSTTAIRNVTNAVGNLNTGLTANVRAITNQAASFNKTKNSIQEARTEIEAFGYQSALAIRRFAAFSVGTAGILGLVGAIKNGISEAIKFDREMVKLSQVTGVTVRGLKDINDEITRLSTTFGVSSTSLLDVSTTLAQAGLTARETKVALEALAKSSLAPSFDNLKDTTEGVIASMRQFSLQAGDVEGALGSINAVAAAFAVESADIITAIRTTGGVFASASKGVREGKDALNEFISIFTSVRATTRESAESIATGLRTIFTRIQRPRTIEYLKEFGINLQDLEGKFVGPYEAVKRLSEGLRSLDTRDSRFAQVTEELGGYRQLGKVIPAIQQFATAQQALQVAQQGSNSLSRDAVTAQQALAVQITKTKEEFLALVRSFAQSATFNNLVSGVLKLADGFIAMGNAIRPLLPYLTILAGIKLSSGLFQFGAGFAGGIKKGGGASGAGAGLASLITGNRGFATGGLVPGHGNSDTYPADLTPGEFVIRKSAVKALGVDTLDALNKYASAGPVKGPTAKQLQIANNLTRAEFYALSPAERERLASNYVAPEKRTIETSSSTKRLSPRNLTVDGPYGGLFFQLGSKSGNINTAPVSIASSELSAQNQEQLAKMFPNNKIGRISGQPYQFYISKQKGDQFDRLAEDSMDKVIDNILATAGGAGAVSQGIGKPIGAVKEIMKNQIGFSAFAGNIFEAYIGAIGRQLNPDRGRSFDFNPVNPEFQQLFGGNVGQAKYADAKLTATSKSLPSILKKAVTAKLAGAADIIFRLGSGNADSIGARSSAILSAIGDQSGIRRTGRATGGTVGSVKSLLTPGEYVLGKSAAGAIGPAMLNKLNNADRIGFADGGDVYDPSKEDWYKGWKKRTSRYYSKNQDALPNKGINVPGSPLGNPILAEAAELRAKSNYTLGAKAAVQQARLNQAARNAAVDRDLYGPQGNPAAYSALQSSATISALNQSNAKALSGFGVGVTGSSGSGSGFNTAALAASANPVPSATATSAPAASAPAGRFGRIGSSLRAGGAALGGRIGTVANVAAFTAAPVAEALIGRSTPTRAGITSGIQGAVGGAALGFAVGGPVGAGIGAAVAGLTGFVQGFKDVKLKEAAEKFEKASTNFDSTVQGFASGKIGIGAQGVASAGVVSAANDSNRINSQLDLTNSFSTLSTTDALARYQGYSESSAAAQDRYNFEASARKETIAQVSPLAGKLASAYGARASRGDSNLDENSLRLLAFASPEVAQNEASNAAIASQLKARGKSTGEINSAIEKERENQGRKVKEAIDKEIKAQKDLAASAAIANQGLELLSRTFEKISASTQRVIAESDKRSIVSEDLFAQSAGQARVGRVASGIDVFENNKAYSDEETAAAFKGLGLNAGSTKKFTDTALSTKALTEELPNFILETYKKDNKAQYTPEDIASKGIDEILKNRGLDSGALPSELRAKILDQVKQGTENTQSSSKGLESFILEFSKSLEDIGKDVFKAGADLQKGLEAANNKYLEGINNYVSASLRVEELKSNNVGATAADTLSRQKLNPLFTDPTGALAAAGDNARIAGLAGGAVNVDDINKNFGALEAKRNAINAQRAATPISDTTAQATLVKSLAQVEIEISKNSKALEIAATATDELSAITTELSRIEAARNEARNQLTDKQISRREAREAQRGAALLDAAEADPNRKFNRRDTDRISAAARARAADQELLGDKKGAEKSLATAARVGFDFRKDRNLFRDSIQEAALRQGLAGPNGSPAAKAGLKRIDELNEERRKARESLIERAEKPLKGALGNLDKQNQETAAGVRAAGNQLVPDSFGVSVASLKETADKLATMPQKITMEGQHVVNVNITGLTGTNLEGPIGDLIKSEINKAMKQYIPQDQRLENNNIQQV